MLGTGGSFQIKISDFRLSPDNVDEESIGGSTGMRMLSMSDPRNSSGSNTWRAGSWF